MSIRAADRLALVTHSGAGTVDLFDLTNAAHPRLARVIDLELAQDEELTSTARRF